jgi:hypothetical protein
MDDNMERDTAAAEKSEQEMEIEVTDFPTTTPRVVKRGVRERFEDP